MKTVPLTKGQVAIVDDEDYERVSQYKWHATRNSRNHRWYAVRNVPNPHGRRPKIRMHRFILNAPSELEVDHKDGNGLNNQRCNLRPATRSQNQGNQERRSEYKGVSYNRHGNRNRRYFATIYHKNKPIRLGSFLTAAEAAMAYDAKAKEIFGEFARPNFASLKG